MSDEMRLPVDPLNPGQVLACCGLLELAYRQYRNTRGWFEIDDSVFCLQAEHQRVTLQQIVGSLEQAGLTGELSPSLSAERRALEDEKKRLKKENKVLAKENESRRKQLGTLLREGNVVIGNPFLLRLDWWQVDEDDIPKTWAGSQEVLKIARAALSAAKEASTMSKPLSYSCVLRPVGQVGLNVAPGPADQTSARRRKKKDPEDDKVEPFYFDSVRGANAHPVDIGFSPNRLKWLTTAAQPATELLCLIGLQRFRPMPTVDPRVFDYCTWTHPMPPLLAAAALCGRISGGGTCYRFENAYRTDQKKHKGFLPATKIGDAP